jgi:hypothetical protein
VTPQDETSTRVTRELARRKALNYRVYGHTYPHRDRLREMGGYYDELTKSWYMPNRKAMFDILEWDPTHERTDEGLLIPRKPRSKKSSQASQTT